MRILTGQGVSAGIASGPALVYKNTAIQPTGAKITQDAIAAEKERVEALLASVTGELAALLKALDPQADEMMADLVEIQLELAEDPILVTRIKSHIENACCLPDAVLYAAEETALQFEGFEDEYYRARAADIRDIGLRMAAHATGQKQVSLAHLAAPVIVFAEDMAPSDTVTMDKAKVLAFVTERGSKTSHTAILAKMLGIPSIVGVPIADIQDGQPVVMDGTSGEVVLCPDDKTIARYQLQRQHFLEEKKRLEAIKDQPAVTMDDRRIELAINISDPREAALVEDVGADCVGLFRTEFIYMDAKAFPNEEQQFTLYKTAAMMAKDKPVIVRTLDIGGDKSLPYLNIPAEENPFLGYRAIRLCLDQPELFKVQLRAILRASAFGRLKIMFPMIGSLTQLTTAKAILATCMEELRTRAIAFDEAIPVGMMVELPNVAASADIFARYVDFFSIGTNDLCQYSLAVDRMNTRIAGLYSHFDPGVLRLIQNTTRAAHTAGIPVGMCGEMASDIRALPLLLAMGLDELSVSPPMVAQIKDAVRKTTLRAANNICDAVLAIETEDEIQKFLEESV